MHFQFVSPTISEFLEGRGCSSLNYAPHGHPVPSTELKKCLLDSGTCILVSTHRCFCRRPFVSRPLCACWGRQPPQGSILDSFWVEGSGKEDVGSQRACRFWKFSTLLWKMKIFSFYKVLGPGNAELGSFYLVLIFALSLENASPRLYFSSASGQRKHSLEKN